MATAALLNSAPAPLRSPSGPAAASRCAAAAAAAAMHLARPKSAKGHRRPSFSCSPSVEAWPCRVPPSPPPAPPRRSVNNRRASAAKPAFPAGRVSPEEIPELLQQVPLRSSSSLNKYRVLPSIGRRGAEEALAEQTERLRVSQGREDAPRIRALSGEEELSASGAESAHVQRPPEELGGKLRQESPSVVTPGSEEPCLLLAVRSPSGQRFQHRFKPTDSLRTVLAVAERTLSAQYKSCSLETTEVPRRSFWDLTRSLHECGILHKSVLCIRRKEQRDADL
ncbi:UBX10 protein, partial [Baryphthengus martii]|nr:UBX10 protein [Baryphthengus martii]